MSADAISKFLHTRLAALLLAGISACGVIAACSAGDIVSFSGQKGLALPSPDTWFGTSPTAGMWVNVAFNIGIMAMMLLINRTYNVLRSMTALHIGLFAIMQMATPSLLLHFNSGTLLALVVTVGQWLLFRTYSAPDSQRDVFMLFFILSAGLAAQYSFAAYILVFYAGCAQMRILRPRTIIASLLGLITVWWLLFGFGIVDPGRLHLPHFKSIFAEIDFENAALLLITLAFTAFLVIASIVANVFKTIAYNARSRAYSGAMALTSLVTIVAMAIDYTDIISYVPMLNCCAAFQVAHFFTIHRRDNAYIGILSIVTIYILLYLWRLTI